MEIRNRFNSRSFGLTEALSFFTNTTAAGLTNLPARPAQTRRVARRWTKPEQRRCGGQSASSPTPRDPWQRDMIVRSPDFSIVRAGIERNFRKTA
jgi:hypothetical protein